MLTAGAALLVAISGAIFNYLKMRDDQDTWQEEQRIALEKKILIKKIKKRYQHYSKIFSILGQVRDIEYPHQHHQELEHNKTKVIEYAEALLEELYGEAGLFMEYQTRSCILKAYQMSYRYANNEIKINILIDAYYDARRLIRQDLQFDDSSDVVSAKDILKHTKLQEKEIKVKKEKNFWVEKGYLARSPRPGYPNQSVKEFELLATIKMWKQSGIVSIISLLSTNEIQQYYEDIDQDLIGYYKDNGFNVVHISVDDFKKPALSKEDITKVLDAFDNLEKPILVHCGAGQDRTGLAISKILQHKD